MQTDGHLLKNMLRRSRLLIYWVLPPVLLFFIFRRVDFQLFFQNLAIVNVWLLIPGLSCSLTVVIVAGIRWRVTLAEFMHLRLPLGYLVCHYWIGMTIGFFLPGQLGLDAYRVVVIGRRYRRQYMQMVLVILIEKFIALANIALLVICMYPVVRGGIAGNNGILDQIINLSYLVALSVLMIVGFWGVVARNRLSHRLINGISVLMLRCINRMKSVLDIETATEETSDVSKIMMQLFNPKLITIIFTASLAIQFVSALGNQIIFQAVGYDIPFVINLFVTPVCYFIFMLPISLGSLGVREGAYILLYGLFGVPAEVALLVSFFNFSGTLLNMGVGALMIWYRRCNNISDSDLNLVNANK